MSITYTCKEYVDAVDMFLERVDKTPKSVHEQIVKFFLRYHAN